MSRLALAAAFALVLTAADASAEVIRNFRVGNWKGGAYSATDNRRQFNHCAALAKYRSGVSVILAVNRSYEWSMGFLNPRWSLTKGNTYDISFTVDGAAPIESKALAINDEQVEVKLPDSSELFNQFRWGRQLTVTTAGQEFGFRLTDTSEVLPMLLECVNRYAGPPARGGGNPFERAGGAPAKPAEKPAAAPPADDAGARVEATALAANVLAQSGISGFQILSPSEMGTLKADAAWRAGALTGTVKVVKGEIKPEQIPGSIIGSDAPVCRGKFLSGSGPDKDAGSDVPRVFTSCEDGADKWTFYYIGVPRPGGGYYVMSTSTKGNEQPAKDADQSIRAAIQKVLSK
ncbi:MAG TPA: hypothetical protein VGD36_18910 [Xanthobacteraceae bacterium]|jgi:hypothetical protein